MPVLRDLFDSWVFLRTNGYEVPWDGDAKPALPKDMPRHDDEWLGFSFFRTGLEDQDLSYLTMPRVYMGRSSFDRVRFQGSDLHESRMCWNDFNDCDFSDCDLSRCDLRGSLFVRCSFTRAILKSADLRHSTFEACDFADARMRDSIIERDSELTQTLSADQIADVTWAEAGPEPEGG